jgi:hypothetical protein
MQQKYLLVPFMMLLIGCVNSMQKVKLIPLKTIVFDLPFEPTLIPIGYCDRSDTQNSFYYFADFRTTKQIAFCNTEGKIVAITDLKPLIKDNVPWYTMQVRARDSIAAISANDHKIIFFNSMGHIIHQCVMPSLNYHGIIYNIMNGPMPPDLNFRHCFSDINPSRYNFYDTLSGKIDWHKRHAAYYSGPTMVRITNQFSDSPVISLQFIGLQDRFMHPHYTSGDPVYLNSETSFYYTNTYADSFYKLNIENGDVISKVRLSSVYSNMGAQSITGTTGEAVQTQGDMVRSTKGVIREGKYDRYRKLIYLMFYHEVPADAKPIHKGEHRPWSMFIYNEQLEKLAEIPFKADTYVPQSLIVNQEGILLKKMDINPEERSYKQTFQQFSIEL